MPLMPEGPPMTATAPIQTGREAFKISRSLEYSTEAELTKQIGFPKRLWPLAIVRELVDNALDHTEEIGRPPEIHISLEEDAIAVWDNGDGIPRELVDGMLDMEYRHSTREAFRCPTRGQMGNAGKCLIGAPVVMNGGEGNVTIVAQGRRHDIRTKIDTLRQIPDVDHQVGRIDDFSELDLPWSVESQNGQNSRLGRIGTFFRVHLPWSVYLQKWDFLQLVRGYATLNPHASFTLYIDGDRFPYPRASTAWKKWTAREKDPPAWYDTNSFERLVTLFLDRDRESGTDRTVTKFLSMFAGLSDTSKVSAITEATGLSRKRLSALVTDDAELDTETTAALLEAMQEHGSSPQPERLGVIGKKNIQRAFDGFWGIGTNSFEYKKVSGYTDGLPYVLEVAFAELAPLEDGNELERIIVSGVNFSAAVDDPAFRDLDWLLENRKVDDESSTITLVHLTTVDPVYVDRGKSVVSLDGELDETLENAIRLVTKDYYDRRKQEEREENRPAPKPKRSKSDDVCLKDAINMVLAESIEKASGGGVCEFSDRDLYYACRDLIQVHTEKPLTQQWFDAVVDEWEIENGIIPNRYRDPRGFLLEPHTGNKIPLGTKEVNAYSIPWHLYHTIVYVEKKGMLSKFELGNIPNKYDAAIIAAEGYAVKAAKQVMQAAQQSGKVKTILCFHDADPDGYMIPIKMAQATGAHHFDIEVIDCGLWLPEGIEMGLQTETFKRKKSLAKELIPTLNEIELEYFTGTESSYMKNGKSKKCWVDCRRLELNALSADPYRFIEYVERKLETHGAANKLVPPAPAVRSEADVERRNQLTTRIRNEFDRQLDVDSKVESLVEKYEDRIEIEPAPDRVEKWSAKLTPQRWTHPVKRMVEKQIDKLRRDIREDVANIIRGDDDQEADR